MYIVIYACTRMISYYNIPHHIHYIQDFAVIPTCKICTCDVSGSRNARRLGEPPPLLGDAACRDLGDAEGVRPPGESQAPRGAGAARG